MVERGQIFVLQDGRISEPFAIPDVPISIAEGLTRCTASYTPSPQSPAASLPPLNRFPVRPADRGPPPPREAEEHLPSDPGFPLP